jgi:hypothetical protein
VTLVFGLLYYYFQLPAINIHSATCMSSYDALPVFFVCEILTTGFHGDTAKSYITHIPKKRRCLSSSSAAVSRDRGRQPDRLAGFRPFLFLADYR